MKIPRVPSKLLFAILLVLLLTSLSVGYVNYQNYKAILQNIGVNADYIVSAASKGAFQVFSRANFAIIPSATSMSANTTLNDAIALGGTTEIRAGNYAGAELIVPENATIIAESGVTGIKYASIANGARIDEPDFNSAFGSYSSGSFTIAINQTSLATFATRYLAFKPDNSIYWFSANASYVIQTALNAGKDVLVKDGSYDIANTINIPDQSTLEGEGRINTIFNWAGTTGGTMLTTENAQVVVRNFFLDCKGIADYGFYTAPATTKWSLLLEDLNVINAAKTCVHIEDQDRPILNRVNGNPSTEAGKGLFITRSFYPEITDCGFTQSSESGLEITYTNAPTIDGGGWSKISIYRSGGAILRGLDLESLLNDDTDQALLIGGESMYGPATIIGGIISNEKGADCEGLRVYDGIIVNVEGTYFNGMHIYHDIVATSGSKVNALGVSLKANVTIGNVQLIGNNLP